MVKNPEETRPTPLTDDQRRQLGLDVVKFLAFLRGRLSSPASTKYDYIDFSDPHDGDWFMEVPEDPNDPVRFNTAILADCGFDYYRMVVLHECVHLLVQDVPNKIDAKRLKDDFGDSQMTFFDVEADYYTYVYHHEFLGYGLGDILQLNAEGRKAFGDTRTRFSKLERFIGASLTIVNHFLKPSPREKEVFLVSTKNIVTENTLHAIVSKSTHFEHATFSVEQTAINGLKECYEGSVADKRQYAATVIEICCQILGKDATEDIDAELFALKAEP